MVTLCTSAYEKDFRITLNKDNWFYNFKSPFVTKKIVLVNNIDNKNEFLKLKKEFEDCFEFYNTSEYILDVFKTFNVFLNPEDISHNYSIHHYVGILLNNNEFGFQVSPDIDIVSNDLTDYFSESIEILNSDESVKSTGLFWVPPESMDSVAKNERDYHGIQKKHEKFHFSKVFSDPVYFYKKNTIMKCDMTNTDGLHPASFYGRNSFEDRMTNHYISQNNYRAIHNSKLYFKHNSL